MVDLKAGQPPPRGSFALSRCLWSVGPFLHACVYVLWSMTARQQTGEHALHTVSSYPVRTHTSNLCLHLQQQSIVLIYYKIMVVHVKSCKTKINETLWLTRYWWREEEDGTGFCSDSQSEYEASLLQCVCFANKVSANLPVLLMSTATPPQSTSKTFSLSSPAEGRTKGERRENVLSVRRSGLCLFTSDAPAFETFLSLKEKQTSAHRSF